MFSYSQKILGNKVQKKTPYCMHLIFIARAIIQYIINGAHPIEWCMGLIGIAPYSVVANTLVPLVLMLSYIEIRHNCQLQLEFNGLK